MQYEVLGNATAGPKTERESGDELLAKAGILQTANCWVDSIAATTSLGASEDFCIPHQEVFEVFD